MPATPLEEYEDIPLPDIPPAAAGWGLRIEAVFSRFLIIVINLAAKGIQRVIAWGLTHFSEGLESEMLDVYTNLLRIVTDTENMPPEIKATFEDILSGRSQAAGLTLGGFGAQMGMGAASSLLAPLFRLMNYAMDDHLKTARADPQVAIAMARRDPANAEWYIRELDDLGWNPRYKEAWDEITKPVLSEGDLLTLWLRNQLSDVDLRDELGRRGWTTERIDQMQSVRQLIPGVGDLINMAVRDVWNPEAVERFNYREDFPEVFAEWAEKQGLSREWAMNYWLAHWTLPGVREGFEMMHRLRPGTTNNPFTVDDLRTLLRIADIPTFFRDRLVEISYTPLTRVDVRRMYGSGVLDRDGVKNSYLDIGYNDENAELMTEFTIRFESEEQRELTRTVITGAFKRGVMSREEAFNSLVDIGYRAEDAELFLSIVDVEIQQAKMNDVIDRVEFLYIEGEINEQGVYTELGPYNLPADMIADLIVEWEIRKQKKISLPTKTELEDLYRRDIITLAALRDGLLKRRYTTQTVDWYIIRLDQRIAEQLAEAAEKAQKEAERIIVSDLASGYRRAVADLNYQISEARAEIADIKLVYHQLAISDFVQSQLDIVSTLVVEKAGIDLEVRGLQRTIAELKYDLRTLEELELSEEIYIQIEALKVDIATWQELVASRELEITEIEEQLAGHARTDEALAWEIRILELRAIISALQTDKARLKLEYLTPPEEGA